MTPHRRARAALAIAAGIVTVALTAGAFWLSYEHLHDIAGAHRLAGSRAWAWPGTVDAFIIVGELLTLRASLQKRIDWWAIALAAFGSCGSIALNISGVGADASHLDYVVAAVPPTAALIAFGALMRQVHEALERTQDALAAEARPDVADAPEPAVAAATTPALPAHPAPAFELDLAPMVPAITEVTADAHPDTPMVPAPTSAASDDELVGHARALAAHGPMSLRRIQRTYGVGQQRAMRIRDALDKEAS